MKTIIAFLLFTLMSGFAFAAPPDKLNDIDAVFEDCIAAATTTVSSSLCGSTAHAAADAVLNATYQAIVSRLAGPGDTETLARLKAAQRAWLPFRDAQCELEAAENLGGTGEGVIFNSCMYQQTKDRVKALKDQFESNE